MRRLTGRLILVALAVFALSACSPSGDGEALSETQKYYFLESLQLVEQAGKSLQTKSLNQQDIKQALSMMDRGLELAFEVRSDFLSLLDARLDKNFQRYFVKGVEGYRLGIEAGDREQQKEGLRLLAKWSEFWSAVKPAVNQKLQPQ